MLTSLVFLCILQIFRTQASRQTRTARLERNEQPLPKSNSESWKPSLPTTTTWPACDATRSLSTLTSLRDRYNRYFDLMVFLAENSKENIHSSSLNKSMWKMIDNNNAEPSSHQSLTSLFSDFGLGCFLIFLFLVKLRPHLAWSLIVFPGPIPITCQIPAQLWASPESLCNSFSTFFRCILQILAACHTLLSKMSGRQIQSRRSM